MLPTIVLTWLKLFSVFRTRIKNEPNTIPFLQNHCHCSVFLPDLKQIAFLNFFFTVASKKTTTKKEITDTRCFFFV